MFNLDTSRPLFSQAKPYLETLSSLRPIVLLPFNIWLYFICMPFRVFFFLTSQLNRFTSKENVDEMKVKAMEIKEEVVKKVPEQLLQQIEQRPALKQVVEAAAGPFGWYKPETTDTVKTVRSEEKEGKKEKPATKKADPLAELKTRLNESEKSEKRSSHEMSRLQKEFDALSKKYETDEKAIELYKSDNERLKTLIGVEQKKCFDLQQQSVSYRVKINQLESAATKPAEKPVEKTEEPAEKPAEQLKSKAKKSKQSKKSQATKPAEMPAEKTEAELEKEDPIHHPHGWHSNTQSHYTEMVAQVQKEELEHGKTFVETLKESIKPASVAEAPAKEEFLVVGGDNSMHHITMPVSAN